MGTIKNGVRILTPPRALGKELTVHLGISGIPKRVESTGPGRDESGRGQDDQDDEGNDEGDNDECS
jgi:hypothetical protein